jgi:hypothetical protein
MRTLTRGGLAVICATSALAGGGYFLVGQAAAGTASPGDGADAGSSTAKSCVIKQAGGPDPAAEAAAQHDVAQLAQALGVSVDRLDQAMAAVKQAGLPLSDSSVAGILAQHLGLDPAVVEPALDQMTSNYPFDQTIATGSGVAPAPGSVQTTAGGSLRSGAPAVQTDAPGPVQGKPAGPADCRIQVQPGDANNPKTAALSGLAASLNVSMSRLMDGFATAAAHGVDTFDDPRMPAALAQALHLDPSTVQQAITVLRSKPPFNGSAGTSSDVRRK